MLVGNISISDCIPPSCFDIVLQSSRWFSLPTVNEVLGESQAFSGISLIYLSIYDALTKEDPFIFHAKCE